ncbi:MAG: DNA polymerase III subunit delta [Actinomycetes bacterium]
MPAPVHLLVGDDDLLLHRETERLVADLRAADPEVDVSVHDVAETEHLPEMMTQSLFGGTTCVVLRGVEEVRNDLKAELEAYLESPSPESILVLVTKGTGKVQKIAKLAKELGELHEVRLPRDFDDRGWDRLVGEEFRRAGRKADAGAVAAVRQHAGLDPSVIATKVAQVVAATGPADVVTAEVVEATIEGHGRRSAFALADAVADRDAAEALVVLRGLLEAGDAPLALLGALTYRFRQLLGARAGLPAKDVGCSPAQLKRLVPLSQRNFGPGELAWCHDRIARADVDLKGSDLPPELVIELAVLDLATPRAVGPPWDPR